MTLAFSICVPTRGRPKSIKRLIESIELTSKEPDKIQVIFRIDEDDKESREIIESIESKLASIDIITGKRCDLSDMWEDCYPTANANRIMMCADDVVFRTKGWDTKIRGKTPNAKGVPYFVWGNDKIQGSLLATLPIVSRKWVELVGYFVPRGYARDWCDTHIYDIAKRAQKHGAGKVMIYFNDIVFEHLHPSVGKSKYDSTYSYRLKQKCPKNKYNNRAVNREKIAKKIAVWVKNKK